MKWGVFAITILFFCCSRSSKQILYFPKEAVVFSVGSGKPLIDWLQCDKVVVYQNMKSPSFDWMAWDKYVVRFPNVKFIFFIEAEDDVLLAKFMHVNRLENFSVFWDQKAKFIEMNNLEREITFISFVVDKEDKIVELSNPSVPGFEKLLKKLGGCRL